MMAIKRLVMYNDIGDIDEEDSVGIAFRVYNGDKYQDMRSGLPGDTNFDTTYLNAIDEFGEFDEVYFILPNNKFFEKENFTDIKDCLVDVSSVHAPDWTI